jgi:RNA polymerase sigma factor (sigma-70 family)
MASPDDATMMKAIRARDPRALEALYREHNARLTGFLTKLIHQPQIVEEVIDDTMMIVWNKPDSFRGACKLSTWIFAIAYRRALKAVRRRDEPVEASEADNRMSDAGSPDESLRRERARRLLLDAIGKLTVDHRTVIILAYFQEKGYQEIAEIMACPVNTIKTRMLHARRRLRQILKGELSEWL